MPIPKGWKVDPNNPDLYKARDKVDGRYIEYVLNVKTGDYTGTEYRAPDGTGSAARNFEPRDLFSYNADDDRITYQNDSFKKLLESNTEKLSVIKNTLPERANEINKTLSQTDGSGITSKDRDELLEKPKFKEIDDTQSSDTETSKQTEAFNAADNIESLGITSGIKRNPNKKFTLIYPYSETNKDIKSQDYIQFEIGKYSPKSLKLDSKKTNLGQLSERLNNLTETYGTISLPIQPSIVDSNSVDWNENNLNPLQVAALQSTIDIANNFNLERITDAAKNTIDSNDGNLSKIGKILIAQKAARASNVISRFGGGIVNPNMELLFNGPQLRPFNFNFRLSPRNESEAKKVREIIRQFKQSMAVKVTTGLFLAAPDIFRIRYLKTDTTDHPSLNRIKLCALKSCVVDYTPENSYMTFKDKSNTMVAYNLSLQFQELDPITDADYVKLDPDVIGY